MSLWLNDAGWVVSGIRIETMMDRLCFEHRTERGFIRTQEFWTGEFKMSTGTRHSDGNLKVTSVWAVSVFASSIGFTLNHRSCFFTFWIWASMHPSSAQGCFRIIACGRRVPSPTNQCSDIFFIALRTWRNIQRTQSNDPTESKSECGPTASKLR